MCGDLNGLLRLQDLFWVECNHHSHNTSAELEASQSLLSAAVSGEDTNNRRAAPAAPLQLEWRFTSLTSLLSDMMSKDEEEDCPDCPLCLNPMRPADMAFPLHCPSPQCDFNMCANCIKAMLRAEADGYEEASDGSKQVKFHLACPMSRAKYLAPDTELTQIFVEEKKEPSCHDGPQPNQKLAYHPIVTYVLLLRQAYSVANILQESDSNLSASNLKKKHEFLQNTTLDDIQEASVNYRSYLKDIGKKVEAPELDWSKYADVPRLGSAGSVLEKSRDKLVTTRAWRDPTLFIGWEELMTLPEQEYVTQLMYSNDVPNLAHASHIMHGVLLGGRQPSDRAIDVISNFRKTAPPPLKSASLSLKPPAPMHPKAAAKMVGRFPLPNHMPRCVVFPVYDPEERNCPVRFETPSARYQPLTVSQVRGVAGRSGMRRGDVVTHVEGQPVYSNEQYAKLLASLFHRPAHADDDRQVMIVVNAHAENARLLRERAQAMQKARVQF